MKHLLCNYYLDCRYDSRSSFYNKARVKHFNDETKILSSYDTQVAVIRDGKAYINGTYSQTTVRHIKEFLKQNNFKAETSKQMCKDYLVSDSEFNNLIRGY
jgi:hypothetical protein